MVSGAVRQRAVLLSRQCPTEPPKIASTTPSALVALTRHEIARLPSPFCFKANPGIQSRAPTRLEAAAPQYMTSFLGVGQLSIVPTPPQSKSRALNSPLAAIRIRYFSTTPRSSSQPPPRESQQRQESQREQRSEEKTQSEQSHLDKHGFVRSEKASKAAHINLRARLSKEGQPQGKSGFAEVWRLIKIARPEVRLLSIAFTFLLLSSAVAMSIPLSVGRVLDLATKDENAEDARLLGLSPNQFFLAFGCLLTIGAIASFSRVILLRIVGERVVARLRSKLYKRTYTQDAEFFDANRVGDLISRLSADAIIVGKGITQNLSDGLRSLVSGAGGFVAMAWISPKLCGILLLMFPPVALGAFFYGRAIRNVSRKIQKALGGLTRIAEERLGNIKTSQAFAGEIQEVARYNHQIRKIFALGKKESMIAATFFGSTGWAGNMTVLALLVAGGNMVKSGALSVGDLTSFMMYTVYAGSSLFGISGFYSELMRSAGAASRLFELQDREPSIPQTVGAKMDSALGPIRFETVSFAYPTRPAVTIFNGLDFEIPSGSNVCIVGPSGGGKSTVASLLLRFYSPTEGRIFINGVDISGVNIKSLRRRIGLVSQEPVLFSGSIAENIAYGKPKASRAEIIAAAQKANCQFISDFPDGLETQVGARGAQLSGGQKQRIAIARALLKDPDILILDEATSALDAESETLVNGAMAALMKGRSTTISIAHRLSTIKRSDQIVVLNSEGTVAEMGSYAQLSADPESHFTKLMEWQMSGGEQLMDRHHHGGPADTDRAEMEEEREEEEEEEEEEVDDENKYAEAQNEQRSEGGDNKRQPKQGHEMPGTG